MLVRNNFNFTAVIEACCGSSDLAIWFDVIGQCYHRIHLLVEHLIGLQIYLIVCWYYLKISKTYTTQFF